MVEKPAAVAARMKPRRLMRPAIRARSSRSSKLSEGAFVSFEWLFMVRRFEWIVLKSGVSSGTCHAHTLRHRTLTLEIR
jgi:hypothetical protein